jgi:MerR family transcriptional regulator, mercuric resistance operon regulatory protein
MLIGELADVAGVTSQAVRFYERKGLLPDAERGSNGYRTYDESTLARLRFIGAAQAAGLTLSEIHNIIDLRDAGTVPCTHVIGLIDTKIADVAARIKHLAALQAELEALREHSRLLDPADCQGDDICHILTSTNPATRSAATGALRDR